MEKINQTKSCAQLLQFFNDKGIRGEKLSFTGVNGKDVYNITAPFENDGKVIIAGRVENRRDEFSEIIFFSEVDGVWQPIDNHPPHLALQDPFITKINDEFIFGGVEVIVSDNDPTKIISWVTQFYRGSDIRSLKPFLTGPEHMKDIRFIALENGKIGAFTRPQGDIGGKGKIGFTTFSNLEEITTDKLANAPIFDDQFIESEWGGVNEAHLLKNGLIGVLGHIACMDANQKKFYYPITFALNPNTLEKTPLKILAQRRNFPAGPAKRNDLQHIIFSGGIIREKNDQATLYAGINDAEAHKIKVPDPFLEYER